MSFPDHRAEHSEASRVSLLPSRTSLLDNEDRYSIGTNLRSSISITDKFSLAADPRSWGWDLSPEIAEVDDALHDPKIHSPSSGQYVSWRGLWNLGCLALLCLAILALFVGYPIHNFVARNTITTSGYNFGGIVNATGQIPNFGNFGLIDLETPKDSYTYTDFKDGSEWTLVFSDEFNTDGRTFYPGDDPYWEAVDLHYWATNNLEWYDPAAITTADGHLVITFEEKETHDLHYQSGMMSSWNKFCFTGGLVLASVQLPGASNVVGMWPAVWTMGNLGRAGYGATLEGTWPYTYDSCDVGTVKNQTKDGLPVAALQGGDADANYVISYLPGQRLSRCTCPGESHPGPVHSDGTYVGRAAPEIDIFEAQVSDGLGEVSQSGQWGPFNNGYVWFDTSDNLYIANSTASRLNSYKGGKTQQSTSVVTETDQQCYELSDNPCFSVYGIQYKPGYDDAYISWISSGKLAWTLEAAGMAADTVMEISARPIPQEPLYLLINLGMSKNFGSVDLEHLTFPNHLRVDYVRVYQDPSKINIGCDPTDFPTADYISAYAEAYTNANLTTWVDDFAQTMPKNSFLGQC
ncbi:beta-glucan synthesis-associated [Mycena floridula]|nr:beta-glucan synthesis-associated [Mycena floridula]